MKISDELRERAQALMEGNAGYTTPAYFNALADCIDAEMAELPRGKDGRPIHVGDTVYDKDGNDGVICTLTLNSLDGKWLIGIAGVDVLCGPNLLTHERHDSLERIAKDIGNYICESSISGSDYCFIANVKDRLRRLAKEDGHES